jgi:hypothetical protein
VAPYTVYTWHVEIRSAGFLVQPQNQGRRFVSGLASKPLRRFSPIWLQNRWRRFLAVWPQNLLRWFLPVWPQNWCRRFLPVWPQNQGGGGFSGLGLKIGSSSLVIWASKSPRRFLGLDLGLLVASQNRRSRSARATHQDLAVCLAWKQVWLGFSSLP